MTDPVSNMYTNVGFLCIAPFKHHLQLTNPSSYVSGVTVTLVSVISISLSPTGQPDTDNVW